MYLWEVAERQCRPPGWMRRDEILTGLALSTTPARSAREARLIGARAVAAGRSGSAYRCLRSIRYRDLPLCLPSAGESRGRAGRHRPGLSEGGARPGPDL